MKLLKLAPLLWSSFFLIFTTSLYSNEPKFYQDNFVDVTYSVEDLDDIRELSYNIEELSLYFNSLFLYRLQEPVSLTIMPSVWDLTSNFSVSSKVGAVWVDNNSFFQPLSVLKKVGRYKKTVFTEYSHFYINALTSSNCPNWFKEGLSYYLWINYSGEVPIKGKRIEGLSYLENFSDYMGSEEDMKNFYYNFLIYIEGQISEQTSLKSILQNLENGYDNTIYSQSCFIVTDVATDKILYIDNEDFANRKLFPGSLLKAFAILSLDNIDEEITYSCSGWSNESTRCWSKASHGEINLVPGLAYSCNSFFIQYLKGRLSLDKYYKTLSKYLNFTGHISTDKFIEESIGLGTNIKTKPIDLLKSYNKIFRETPNGIESIRQGMKDSTYYGTGTQFTQITDVWNAAAKTGTSYHINLDGTLDWKSNTGWFLILYPADEPKYSFLKVIEKSKSELAVIEGSKDFLRWLDEN